MKFDEKNWPVGHAFTTKLGDGSAKIAVFADPNCGWCKRLVQETLSKMENLTVYWFFYPVLGEDSVVTSAVILSSKTPNKAWYEWCMDEKAPTGMFKASQMKVLEDNSRLAEKLKIETVPAIFLEDGAGPFGFMTAMELGEKIQHS
ncbi:DsbC family protein [Turicimonas muris]|uniref:DsbC family protein n=1 Tax=Turicimonas muris TaxID=1796652 RepID=UPI00249516ED|nr:DsbC family protein [Turicimonas muris]